ncbi:MAG: hypothetical protein JXQ65_06220 [Candidatus Marinimicrobia bacterium]|nr:hypothetical protein [Candidatus Neomarinimicrobiota bacterium]
MAIQFTTKIEDEIFFVTTLGFDGSLSDVKQYAADLIKAGVKTGLTKALIDERQLIYKLGTVDLYELGEFIAVQAPSFAKIALVPNENKLEDTLFFEDVVINRGLKLKIFRKMEEAKEWLVQ